MEVRFAEEKTDKFGAVGSKGGGKTWHTAGKGGARQEEASVPVTVGLRVRNAGNNQTGRVVACRGRTPGTFRVLFDNGQEWEWEVKRFESEDGWPLLDAEALPATINLRVRCWMDGRCGRIAYIHNDWPQRIWVMFDDGEEGEKDAAWFVSEDGCYPIGPGHSEKDWKYSTSTKGSKGSGHSDYHQPSWDASWASTKGGSAGQGYQSGKGGKSGKGYRQQDYQWGEPEWQQTVGRNWQETERPPMRNRAQDTWWESSAKTQGQGKGKSSKGTHEERWTAKGAGKERRTEEDASASTAPKKGKGKGEGKGDSAGGDAEERALREVIDQLLDESNAGRVWITNWPGRFQSKLGHLREFLERHTDKFTVIPGNGRRYTVAFSGGAPPAGVATGSSKQAQRSKPVYKWAKSRPDGDAAGGGAGDDAGPRSAIRRSAGDSTAFDAEDHDEHEDSDDPVEDAMRSRDQAEEDKEGTREQDDEDEEAEENESAD